ncbi:hypothetical protein M378DRAFT_760595 [Amanita muscaria Koide BX008]|uniref:Secreted protein n=1 Tax=Amanita muscaria (strain Koide BX008) TaxID=946122 RepID=A0A0C2X025_AMAMK|nr:hypothetical protein M378DRAFT_760595 [Amanita muscaria Koide BX008]
MRHLVYVLLFACRCLATVLSAHPGSGNGGFRVLLSSSISSFGISFHARSCLQEHLRFSLSTLLRTFCQAMSSICTIRAQAALYPMRRRQWKNSETRDGER